MKGKLYYNRKTCWNVLQTYTIIFIIEKYIIFNIRIVDEILKKNIFSFSNSKGCFHALDVDDCQ